MIHLNIDNNNLSVMRSDLEKEYLRLENKINKLRASKKNDVASEYEMIQDLIPSYVEEICSKLSKKYVASKILLFSNHILSWPAFEPINITLILREFNSLASALAMAKCPPVPPPVTTIMIDLLFC